MNWRSTQRVLGSREGSVNYRSNTAGQRGISGGKAYSTPEYKAVYDAFATKPPRPINVSLDTFVKALVDGGVWSKLETLNVKTLHTNENGEALIDWVTPSNSLTTAGTVKPYFKRFSGFVGSNGGNGRIQTGFTPSTAIKFSQNSASVFVYKKTLGETSKVDIGSVGTNGSVIINPHLPTPSLQYCRLNNIATNSLGTITGSIVGLWTLNRNNSANFDIWVNKVKKGTANVASTGLSSREVWELALNDATPTGYSTGENSIFGAGSALTDAEIAILSDACTTLITTCDNYAELTNKYSDTNWANSAVLATYNTHKVRSPYSEYSFNTEATSITISAIPTILNGYPIWSYLTIYIDDVLYTRVQYTTDIDKDVTLPAGNKKVTILTNVTSKPIGGSFISVSPIRILVNGAVVNIPQGNVASKLVCIGDSIISGGNTTYPEIESFGRLYKVNGDFANIAYYSWGYATLADMASDSTKINATVAAIQAHFSNTTATKKILLAIGTNDFGLNSLAAATFGTYYANLLDAIHTADASIIVNCLSPLYRTSETSLLADYRTQISNICTARPDWTKYIDGQPILVAGDLGDGVHPNIGGHVKVYNATRLTVMS